MPLYIRDDQVDELATKLQHLTGTTTKTQVVRQALEREISRLEAARPLEELIAKSMALADAMGAGESDFDMKAFTDEMWEA
ncbi:MAG: histidinol dehydrogenase [Hyphomicrobiales bacterium]|nr:MAG: histidinol dehydrogenase [Hyphomicrobiales bacterium]